MSRTKRIQERMKQLGITYKHIAQHIMLSEERVRGWCENNNKLPYEYVWKICDLLNMDVCDMMVML